MTLSYESSERALEALESLLLKAVTPADAHSFAFPNDERLPTPVMGPQWKAFMQYRGWLIDDIHNDCLSGASIELLFARVMHFMRLRFYNDATDVVLALERFDDPFFKALRRRVWRPEANPEEQDIKLWAMRLIPRIHASLDTLEPYVDAKPDDIVVDNDSIDNAMSVVAYNVARAQLFFGMDQSRQQDVYTPFGYDQTNVTGVLWWYAAYQAVSGALRRLLCAWNQESPQ
jgi:hypothetical protein